MTWKWSNDSWLSRATGFDKWAHAGGSALFTCAACNVLAPWFNHLGQVLFAGAFVFLCGLALEMYQAFKEDGFSWRDLTADALGILIAMAAIL